MSSLRQNAAALTLLAGLALLLLAALCFFLMLATVGGCVSGGGCHAQETTISAFDLAARLLGIIGAATLLAGMIALLWQRLQRRRPAG